jgi:tRNA U34 5-methylaminomethyl-2-thiouridine-forming methyltransferase MnmC
MIKGQSKSLYQFGLMLTSSTLSLAWKQAAINHSLANLKTKHLANKEKIKLEEKKIQLKERKLALLQATAKAKRPWLFESSDEGSNMNNDDNKP